MFFEDREVLYREESPSGRWRLTIYEPADAPEGEKSLAGEALLNAGLTYFAEFEKTSGIIAVGFPFGGSEKGAKVEVDWTVPGKVCAVTLDGELYLLLKWGVCFIKPRELNKLGSEGPITDEEAAPFLEAARKENPS